MARTDNFRKQHDDLLAQATEILNLTNRSEINENVDTLRRLIARLAGKLKLHLAIEDDSLYPELYKQPDKELQDTAMRFNKEMGGINTEFQSYLDNWPISMAITNDPDNFIKETKSIFGVLAERINKENTVLYNMADRNLS